MNSDDYYRQMIPGDEWGPKFLIFFLLFRKTPVKHSTRKLTRPGIEPGPAALEATTLRLDHSGGFGHWSGSFNKKQLWLQIWRKLNFNSNFKIMHYTPIIKAYMADFFDSNQLHIARNVCSNANPMHYYALRVPRKSDRLRWVWFIFESRTTWAYHITCGMSICIVYFRKLRLGWLFV